MKTDESDKELLRFCKDVEEAIRNGKYPSAEEMVKLNKRRIAGDEKARELMIVGNLPLAHWFASRHKIPGTPDYDDEFQIASIGIMKAVDRFDPAKGSFGTVAGFWIRQHTMRHYQDTSRTVRNPVHIWGKQSKIRKQIEELSQKLSRQPTLEEISNATKMSTWDLQMLFQAQASIGSIDAPIEMGDGSVDRYDRISDDRIRTPSGIAEIKDECELAVKVMKRLHAHMQEHYVGTDKSHWIRILYRRYGIFGFGPKAKKLEELGKEFGVTRERIRQICAQALQGLHWDDIPIADGEQLNGFIERIRLGIEALYETGGTITKDMLWIISELPTNVNGNGSNGHKPKPVPKDNSPEAILHRILDVVRKVPGCPVRAEVAAARMACDDFSIPVKDSGFFFALKASAIPALNDLGTFVDKVRKSYTLSILCADPQELWNRQGRLFPSQQKEAQELLLQLESQTENVRNAVAEHAHLLPEVKAALMARYGSAQTEPDPDMSLFARTADIEPREAQIALRNVWNFLKKRCSFESDDEYWKALEDISLLRLLIGDQ